MPVGFRGLLLALAAVLLFHQGVGAQLLAITLFERYLEPLRVQAGIPGLSAAIVQDGQLAWAIGLGYRDLEGLHHARADTPYPIGDLTQSVTAGLLLHCVEQGAVSLDEPIGRWLPAAESPSTTLFQLLTHTSSVTGGYRYDPSRYALLAKPIETCVDQPFRKAMAHEVLDFLGMTDAVPGYDTLSTGNEPSPLFDDATLERYAALLQRMAVPYRVDRRGRPSRSALPSVGMDGAYGLIASVRDLAKFDAALNVYLRPETLAQSWTNTVQNGAASPFGMGWFVQMYQGEKLVWHFGNAPDAFSSLMLKVPSRRLTLILLANSDGLSAPFSLQEGDVTTSLFARTFLRLFI